MTSNAAAKDLAPTGIMRVAVMYSNPVLAAGHPAKGNLRGIAVDMAQALSRHANLPLKIIGYETRVSLLAGEWDAAFAAYDTQRAGIRCTAPFLETQGTYLVPPGSPIDTIDGVDSDDVLIAVSASSALDLHLSRTLLHARLERIPGAHGAASLFISGKANVLAGLRQQLMKVAPELPGSRILDGHFMAIRHALAIRAEHNAGYECLCEFVEFAKSSGLVAQLIAKNGILGVSVSPAA